MSANLEDLQQANAASSKPPDQNFDGRRLRKAILRRWRDHHQAFAHFGQNRPFQSYDLFPQNIPNQYRSLEPPCCYQTCGPYITTKFIRHMSDKHRSGNTAMAWQPDGKRLNTGDQTGVIALWNGTGFQFEFRLQAHKEPISDITWSHSGDYLLTISEKNEVSVWQSNYNSILMFPIHSDSINGKVRQLSFSPTDRKFASCSDDCTVRIWDLSTQREDYRFNHHGQEVRTVEWHPSKSLICSGGKENSIKFFDPRVDKALSTLTIHKNSITRVAWNQNGHWLLSGARDSIVRLSDVRMMKEIESYQGHERDVFTVSWNPLREDTFVSAGYSGEIHWWCTGVNKPLYSLAKAHNKAIFHLKYNPIGTVLASTGQDGIVKFWVRNQIGGDLSKSANEIEKVKTVVSSKKKTLLEIPGLSSATNIPTESIDTKEMVEMREMVDENENDNMDEMDINEDDLQ